MSPVAPSPANATEPASPPAVAGLRLGLDAREAFREAPRGIGLYIRHLLREYATLAPELEILAYHDRDRPGDLELPANVTSRKVDVRGSRVHAWERVGMPWRMRRDRVDVYHGPYNTLPPNWPMWSGPPMVATIHDVIVTWLEADLDDPFVRYARKVTQRSINQAARILTVSEWSRQEIIDRFGAAPDKVQVTYNGVHPKFFEPLPDSRLDAVKTEYASGRDYLFSVGAPLLRKNTWRLIDALAQLHAKQPLDRLVLISGVSEPRKTEYRERAEKAGLGDLVRFLPYVSREELIALYAAADLSIYPSQVEGWGIPVVESLVVGTPVVTSNSSGMVEAGGPHARLFDPNDTDDMANTIAEAIEALPEFDSAAAIERARTFTWTRAARQTLEAYAELAGRV